MIDFGDKVKIEMKRHGVPNEFFVHKVIGRIKSNSFVNVPIQSPATEVLHSGEIVSVLTVVQEGIHERNVFAVRESDVSLSNGSWNNPHTSQPTKPRNTEGASNAKQ